MAFAMSLYSSKTTSSINSPAKKLARNSSMARPCPLLAFCGLFLFFFFLPCLSCPEHQKQALLQFKSSILAITSSFNSSNSLLQSWNSNSSCCRWDGVECSHTPNSTSGPVIGLNLMGLFTDLSPQPRCPPLSWHPFFTSEAWRSFSSDSPTYKVKSRQLGLLISAIWLT